MTASPISGWWSGPPSATSPSRTCLPSRGVDRHLGQVRPAVTMGRMCRTPSRWFGRVDEPAGADHRARSENRSSPTSSASAVTSMTWFSVTPCLRHPVRVDLDLQH